MEKISQTFFAAVLFCGTSAAWADAQLTQAAHDFLNSTVKPWLNSGQIIEPIKAQNNVNAALSQDQVEALDQRWRAQVDTQSRPLVDEVVGNPLSAYLRELKKQHEMVITEMFVMDAKGFNVGQSNITSDYWQGDEAKWQKSFGAGAGAVFVDDVDWDESTQRFQTQISTTISDPVTQEVIGAITIAVDADWLSYQ